jgi:hypothetical protein
MRDAIAFAAFIVLMLGARVLLRRRRPSPAAAAVRRADGALVLKPPRKNGVLMAISALVPAAILGAFTFQAWNVAKSGAVLGIAATLTAVAVAAYLLARAGRACVVVHDTGLESVGVRRRRVVHWKDVSKLAFNPMNHWFFVTVSDGSHLWLPADVPGMDEFARIALRRLPPAVLEGDRDAREVLEELAEVR